MKDGLNWKNNIILLKQNALECAIGCTSGSGLLASAPLKKISKLNIGFGSTWGHFHVCTGKPVFSAHALCEG